MAVAQEVGQGSCWSGGWWFNPWLPQSGRVSHSQLGLMHLFLDDTHRSGAWHTTNTSPYNDEKNPTCEYCSRSNTLHIMCNSLLGEIRSKCCYIGGDTSFSMKTSLNTNMKILHGSNIWSSITQTLQTLSEPARLQMSSVTSLTLMKQASWRRIFIKDFLVTCLLFLRKYRRTSVV